MTKAELIKSISLYTGFSQVDSGLLLDQFLEATMEILEKNKIVKFRGFGTFKVVKKSSRIGRNPKTMKEFVISERNVISFKPSRQLKKLINESRRKP